MLLGMLRVAERGRTMSEHVGAGDAALMAPEPSRRTRERRPTRSQIDLLRAVAEERVTMHHASQGRMVCTWQGHATLLDAMPRVERLWANGWVTSEERPPVHERGMSRTFIVLTDEGRRVLHTLNSLEPRRTRDVRDDPTDDNPGWWRWCHQHQVPRNRCREGHATTPQSDEAPHA
jgi:hypothetical protein